MLIVLIITDTFISCIFDKVLPDPLGYIIEECALFFNEEKIDGIVEVGGGSTMDVLKVTSIYRDINERSLMDYLNNVVSMPSVQRKVYLILLPITSGTGAKMTAGGIITDSATGEKRVFINLTCSPDLALVDPQLTIGLPPYVTATSVLDALSHIIECMTGIGCSALTEMAGEKIMPMICRSLQ